MYLYEYACVYEYMYVYIDMRMYLCMCLHMYVTVYEYVSEYVYILYACTETHVSERVYMFLVCMYESMCISLDMHIHMSIFMNVCKCPCNVNEYLSSYV